MKKIRFGIIGTNFITDWVLKGAFQDERFELTAICSRTKEKADEFGDKYGVPHRFTSESEMAQSDLIDAVYIASPNFKHASQSIMFLNAGKHVLCEKAFASNALQVREMIRAAKNSGKVLMEAMKPVLTPCFISAMENIHKIGKLRKYFSSYCQYSSRYDKFKEGIVLNAFNPEYSNGAVMDIGVYTIYPMVVLFGRPLEIKANGIMLASGVDGEGSVTFKYKDMDAVVIYSKISNSSLPTEIQGEEGNIVFNKINIISSARIDYRNSETEDLTVNTDKDEYFFEIKEFIDLIVSKKSESKINSLENSLITMEIMDEIRKQVGVKYSADNN